MRNRTRAITCEDELITSDKNRKSFDSIENIDLGPKRCKSPEMTNHSPNNKINEGSFIPNFLKNKSLKEKNKILQEWQENETLIILKAMGNCLQQNDKPRLELLKKSIINAEKNNSYDFDNATENY